MAAIACMDVENPGAGIAEARGKCAFVKFELLNHVAVEGRARTCDVLALQHVKALVEKYVVKIQTDSAVIGAAHGKTSVEIIVGGDAGKALHGAQGIVCKNAGEIADVISRQHKTRRAVFAGSIVRAGGYVNRVGPAQIIGAQNDLEFLRLSCL